MGQSASSKQLKCVHLHEWITKRSHIAGMLRSASLPLLHAPEVPTLLHHASSSTGSGIVGAALSGPAQPGLSLHPSHLATPSLSPLDTGWLTPFATPSVSPAPSVQDLVPVVPSPSQIPAPSLDVAATGSPRRKRMRTKSNVERTPRGRRHGRRNSSPELASHASGPAQAENAELPFWTDANFARRENSLQAKDLQRFFYEDDTGNQICGFCRFGASIRAICEELLTKLAGLQTP
jgi:hypothetical protein